MIYHCGIVSPVNVSGEREQRRQGPCPVHIHCARNGELITASQASQQPEQQCVAGAGDNVHGHARRILRVGRLDGNFAGRAVHAPARP